MATRLIDTQTSISTTGVKPPATLTKWPEGGATAQVGISGTSPTCTVQLRAWNNSAFKEILATFVLPVVGGAKNGDLFDSLPVFSIWENWDWNVTAIGGTPNLTLTLVGVGV